MTQRRCLAQVAGTCSVEVGRIAEELVGMEYLEVIGHIEEVVAAGIGQVVVAAGIGRVVVVAGIGQVVVVVDMGLVDTVEVAYHIVVMLAVPHPLDKLEEKSFVLLAIRRGIAVDHSSRLGNRPEELGQQVDKVERPLERDNRICKHNRCERMVLVSCLMVTAAGMKKEGEHEVSSFTKSTETKRGRERETQ